jgi:hypothetical protein
MRGEIVLDPDLEGPSVGGERLGPRGVNGGELGRAPGDDRILAGAAQSDDLGVLLARLDQRRRGERAEADLTTFAIETVTMEP